MKRLICLFYVLLFITAADSYGDTHEIYHKIDVNDISAVLYLFEKNATRIPRFHGYSPYLYAVVKNRYEIVAGLLKTSIDTNERGPQGETALHIAMRLGHEKIYMLLIKSGIDFNILDDFNNSCIHNLKGAPEVIEYLAMKGLNVSIQNNDGDTPLHMAARNDSVYNCYVLISCRADTGIQNNQGMTPLHIAARRGVLEIVEQLTAKNTINTPDNCGNTPLHYAVLHDFDTIIKFLLEYGADASIKNNQGHTPADCAQNSIRLSALFGKIKKKDRELLAAVKSGNGNAIARLLHNGANVNCFDTGLKTPLHWAVIKNDLETAKILLLYKADVNAANIKGYTPVFYSVRKGNREITELLICYNAELDVFSEKGNPLLLLVVDDSQTEMVKLLLDNGASPDLKNNNGFTPLHFCASMGDVQTAVLLLEAGADVNAPNIQGKTPLSFAAEEGHSAMVRLLITHGADVNAVDVFMLRPLSWAMMYKKKETSLILLDSGLDLSDDVVQAHYLNTAAYFGLTDLFFKLIKLGVRVDLLDRFGRSALQAAAQGDSREIAAYVLEIINNAGTQRKEGFYDIDHTENKGNSALYYAAGNSAAITTMLIQSGADVDLKNNEMKTPLHDAVLQDEHEAVVVLLENGARVDITDKYSNIPLNYIEHPKTAHILIEAGSDVNHQGNHLWAPLHFTCRNGYLEAAHVLLDHGANPNIRNDEGNTPLHIAAQEKDIEMLQLLIQYGADIAIRNNDGKTAFEFGKIDPSALKNKAAEKSSQ